MLNARFRKLKGIVTYSAYKQVSHSLVDIIKTKEMAKGKISMVGAIALSENPAVKKALLTNDRALVIKTLGMLDDRYKDGTPFKNVKVHIHTKDVKSFLRVWKPKKFGDDLSGFRNTILKVRDTHKPLRAIEVGRAGLVVRGLSPILIRIKII